MFGPALMATFLEAEDKMRILMHVPELALLILKSWTFLGFLGPALVVLRLLFKAILPIIVTFFPELLEPVLVELPPIPVRDTILLLKPFCLATRWEKLSPFLFLVFLGLVFVGLQFVVNAILPSILTIFLELLEPVRVEQQPTIVRDTILSIIVTFFLELLVPVLVELPPIFVRETILLLKPFCIVTCWKVLAPILFLESLGPVFVELHLLVKAILLIIVTIFLELLEPVLVVLPPIIVRETMLLLKPLSLMLAPILFLEFLGPVPVVLHFLVVAFLPIFVTIFLELLVPVLVERPPLLVRETIPLLKPFCLVGWRELRPVGALGFLALRLLPRLVRKHAVRTTRTMVVMSSLLVCRFLLFLIVLR